MKQHILTTTVLAVAVPALALGQNLNPTVEVTNAYEGGASSLVKPLQKMAVPDSVMTFNLDFDYSVFEKPYQGAYEFRPYLVQLKPLPTPSTENTLYLRLGAGFTFRPELDFVWNPVRTERYQVGVHASHASYFGRYHKFDPVQEEAGEVFRKNGTKVPGYLMDTRVGVNGGMGWGDGEATLDVSYRHRMANDDLLWQRTGGLEAQGRVRSLTPESTGFLYDAALRYHFYGTDHSGNVILTPVSSFTESRFDLDGTFGPVFGPDRRLVADLDMTIIRYGKDLFGYTGGLSLTPKYEFALDDWRFSLGVRLSSIIYSEEYWNSDYRVKSGRIFPAVHVDYTLLDDRLILQASATGGDKILSMADQFEQYPFAVYSSYGHGLERIRAMIGARGNIASRFRYDLQAGYSRWSRSPVESFRLENRVEGLVAIPALSDGSYNLLFADLDYGWKSQSVTVDGRLSYKWTKGLSDWQFAPAAFTGWVRPSYNWGDRFKGGLDIAWSTRRKALRGEQVYMVPGWMDLGLFAEYRFTRKWGFWAKGGNLLNQAVQAMPLHAEAGMYATVGIVLNF